MREIKLKPIIVAFIVVLVLLAGGSFTYQYVAQQKPLEQSLASLDYSHIEFPITKQEGIYQLKLEVQQDYKLLDAMNEVKDVMHRHDLDEFSFTVKLQNKSSELQQIWQSKLFAVAEIMANQSYSKLPELVEAIESEHAHVRAVADIDERYVYITLLQDDQRFDALLPLDGGKMEVWHDAK